MATKENEFFSRNAELSIEFSKYVLEHPELDNLLDEQATIIFLPEFAPDLKAFNLKIAKELEKEQVNILYVRVENMSHRPISRLDGVEITTTLRRKEQHVHVG